MKHTLSCWENRNICTGQWIHKATPPEFLLIAKRNPKAAERFLRKTLITAPTQQPRVINNVDKNAAYPQATNTLKADDTLPKTTQSRQKKYLHNVVK